ncbi:TRAP transporter substrate-binding protein [Okeania sp. SIO2B3]|uniref:TRAP transporter substrate-binding protein n=1 Tax=Okeania sp. SIO2B3 TaxID=2607784 RepID=UPI0013C0892E|nr:TRAP transporter substrate-binding protein [Okeania sp. SIO2B3]NET45579.1 TRAP transporter substrate-binding protein [Okeania sp. SIO2B3]
MKRRKLINHVAGAASVATLAACSQTTTQTTSTDNSLPSIKWRMTTSWPRSLDTIFGGAQTLCDRVAAMTNGKFEITPYSAGEIVGGLEVLETVQQGTVQCGHTASYYYVGKNPALAFGTTVPFGLTAQQQNAWYYHGGGLEIMHKLYSDFNIISFPAGNSGVQMGGWFKREINTVNDLKGLTMRIPGFGGEVMKKLGVNTQVIPGGEIYLALERGAIDAAEWVGPYDDQKLGLNNAAKYYYYPGWWEPGPTFEVQVNLDEWNQLPKEYQEAFKTATYQANINMLAKYDALNGAALAELIAKGTELRPYSQEILQAAQTAAFEFYEEKASQDATFKEVYEQWKKFREQIYKWNAINELSFAQFTFNNSLK